MLGADVVVPQDPGLLLGQDHHLSGSFCEPFEHHCLSPMAGRSRPRTLSRSTRARV